MAYQLESKKMNNIVETALREFHADYEFDRVMREKARNDIAFAFKDGEQWDSLAKERRRGKPMYTINKIAPAINDLVGSYRQNRIEMKARPAQDASKDEADTYNGLIRAILSGTDSEQAKDYTYKMICTGGFGAIRVTHDYSEDNPFEQDVMVTPIYNALEKVWFDRKSEKMDASDGDHVFEIFDIPRDEFKERWPNASLKEFPDPLLRSYQRDWGVNKNGDTVRVADYYVKEKKTEARVLLTDGSIISGEAWENTNDELREQGLDMVDVKDATVTRIMCYRISGSEVLEQPYEVQSNRFPIVRVLGFYSFIDSELTYSGIVRYAKDPQMVYNYATSANIENVALKPKDKVLATNKMIKGHERKWRNLSTSNDPIVTYTPDPEAPDAKPIPFSGGQGSAELLQQAQQAEMDLQSTIGRRSPAQNESAKDRSGRAILALQKQDDTSTYELLDNLAQGWESVAKVVMGMIPRIYDSERQVSILNDDGEEFVVTLNETIKDEETGKEYVRNDVNKRYRIKATIGPAFETKRTEAVNVLASLADNPQFGVMIPDLLAKSMDFTFSDELTKRMRKIMLQQGLVEMTDEEKEERMAFMQTPEGQAQMQQQQQQQQLQMMQLQLQMQRQQLENANLEANIANLQAATSEKASKAAKDAADIQETYADVFTKQVDAMVTMVEQGLPIQGQQLNSLVQSLELLDATQRDDYQRRIMQALQQAQQLRPRA